MPRELSPSEEREYSAYLALGPLEDVRARLGKLPKVQEEAKQRRERIEALEKENGEVKAKVPEGAVVLTGDEATAYTALHTAGKTLKSLSDDQGELETLRKKDAARSREDGWRKAAKAEGYDPDKAINAFGKLAGFGDLPFEVKKAKVEFTNGAKKEEKEDDFGFVTVDGKTVRLGEYLQQNADFLIPGLKPSGNGGTTVDAGRREVPDQRGGGGGGGRTNTALQEALERNRKAAEAPNPLRPAKTA